MINYDKPLIRRLLFPIYSLKELAWLIILLFIVGIVSIKLLNDHKFVPILFGYIGWIKIGYSSSPATLLVNGDIYVRSCETLKKSHFVFNEGGGYWENRLPKFMQWDRGRVFIERGVPTIIHGPVNVLKYIRKVDCTP